LIPIDVAKTEKIADPATTKTKRPIIAGFTSILLSFFMRLGLTDPLLLMLAAWMVLLTLAKLSLGIFKEKKRVERLSFFVLFF